MDPFITFRKEKEVNSFTKKFLSEESIRISKQSYMIGTEEEIEDDFQLNVFTNIKKWRIKILRLCRFSLILDMDNPNIIKEIKEIQFTCLKTLNISKNKI